MPAPSQWWTRITRDVVLFGVGLALTINEGVVRSSNAPERPSLLVLYAGMMGLPAILRYDETRRTDRRHRKRGDDE